LKVFHVALQQIMAQLPPLNTLLAFEAVARLRSFARAAAEMNLTASAISHQMAKLEAHVGQRLVERSAGSVRLSPTGEEYLRRISAALGALTAATQDARQPSGRSLYVHVSPSLASLWLMPRLAGFAQRFPEISLQLSASPLHSDFALGPVDLDIRYGHPQWPNLVVEPLFEEQVMPLASPVWLAQRPMRQAADVLAAPLIRSTVSVVQWADWLAAQGVSQSPERFALRFDRAQLSLDAAVQGLGVALESTTMAAAHLREGRLQAVFGPASGLPVKGHHLVYPAAHARRSEVQAFIEWLKDEAAMKHLQSGQALPHAAPQRHL
jgi:DNA-binding transcriptional LysR family regulator